MKSRGSTVARWENMDYDILMKIFMTLNIMDLIFSVSRVCSSWRSACSDPVLWEMLNLSKLKSNSINIPRGPCASSADQYNQRFMQILKNAFSLSHGNVTCLILPFFICIKDEHLIYAAERCPKLKRLVLPSPNHITVDGFRKAVQKWEGLEAVTVPWIYKPSQIMEVIGANCKNFSEVKIMCPFDKDLATAIVTYIPKLKVLSLRCSVVFKEALILILNCLDHLEVLNIVHCILIEVPQPPAPITIYRELDASIIEKASSLQKFLACQEESCTKCQPIYYNEHMQEKYDCEEGLWRVEEVSNLGL